MFFRTTQKSTKSVTKSTLIAISSFQNAQLFNTKHNAKRKSNHRENGFFEYNVILMGQCNPHATFQCLIDSVLEGLIGKICFVYVSFYQSHNAALGILVVLDF
jgi:hypothetical protein